MKTNNTLLNKLRPPEKKNQVVLKCPSSMVNIPNNWVVTHHWDRLMMEGMDVMENYILNYLDFEDILRFSMASKNIYALLNLLIKPMRIVTKKKIPTLKVLKNWMNGSSLVHFECPNVAVCDEDVLLFPSSLKSLDLRFDHRLTGMAIKNLPRNLKKLTLCNANIGNASLQFLPTNLLNLTLINNNKITDLGLKYLPRTLKYLDLRSNTLISDNGLKNLPPNLAHLNLHDNNNITNEGIKYLPRTLTHLDLHSNNQIGDSGISFLPPSIKYLDLHSTRNITDSSIPLLPRCLTYLDLFSNKKITNLSLKNIPSTISSYFARTSRLF